MTFEFWLGILIGAFAGYYLPIWAKILFIAARRYFALRAIRATPGVNAWIVDYYASRGRESTLFQGTLASEEGYMPFLSTPATTAQRPLDSPESRSQLLFVGTTSPVSKVSGRRIARRRRAGKRLYDAPILHVDAVELHPEVRVRAIAGRYLPAVSTWFGLEEETIKAVRAKKTPKTNIRDAYFADFASALASREPKLIGIGVPLVVVEAGAEPRILLQRSSSEIASAMTGNYGVIPALSASPVLAAADRSLLEMNILREIAEELFGMAELEDVGEERLDSTWFLRVFPLSQIAADLQDGAVRLVYLSSGFEGLNGTFEIHVALEVDAGSGTAAALQDAAGNWEVAHDRQSSSLMLTPLFSPEIDAWYRDGRLSIGSAVAIVQLRRRHRTSGP